MIAYEGTNGSWIKMDVVSYFLKISQMLTLCGEWRTTHGSKAHPPCCAKLIGNGMDLSVLPLME